MASILEAIQKRTGNTPVAASTTKTATTASDGKYYNTGVSGKSYVYNPTSGNVMVNGKVVSSTDAAYNATLSAMKNDGISVPSTTTKPTTGVSGASTSTPSTINKPYQTSSTMKSQTGTNTSTHITKASGQLDPNDKRMTVDQNGNWVSDQYGTDNTGTYVLKGGNVNNKVYMNDTNKQYFANNYGGTGAFSYDANNKVTYDGKTQAMRTDKDYNTLGDANKFSPDKVNDYVNYGKKYEGMTAEQLNQAKQSATGLEKNYISSIDNTILQDGKFKGVAPIAFTPEAMQENLANFVYNDMRKEGMGAWQGVNTKAIDEMLNSSGLAGMIDVNNVNVPYIIEQQIKAQAKANGDNAYLEIDPKAILSELVNNGGLKEGYLYDQKTGQITVDPRYTQLGDTLADKGEAVRWYGSEQNWFDQRTRNENVTGQMAETPLELRARYQPDTMTDEMKADLETERQIKTELEQLTLQLAELDKLSGGSGSGLVLNTGSLGAGAGSTSGLSNGNSTNTGYGLYGAGGDSTFNTVTGGGKGAVYGTSQNYTNADINLLNAQARRLG